MSGKNYDGHNRKAGHAKSLRELAHRRARRMMRRLLGFTVMDWRIV